MGRIQLISKAARNIFLEQLRRAYYRRNEFAFQINMRRDFPFEERMGLIMRNKNSVSYKVLSGGKKTKME